MGKIRSIKKKGIFFTFISLTIAAVFILLYTPQADITLQKDTQSIRSRINDINSYANDLEHAYYETVLRATTHKAILSLILYMNSTGNYLANFNASFSEVMINGTINGLPIDSITKKKIMSNNTLINWTNILIKTSQDTHNINVSVRINKVSAFQTKPWNVDSMLNIDYDVKSNVAQWKKSNVTIMTTISIEGLPDPYYIINTNKKHAPEVKRSSVEFNKWNLTYVREHLRNTTYVHWQDSEAPSFLMRFTNTIEASNCCGIESLVDPNKISQPDQRESYVDYLFWTHEYNSQCPLLYNITNPLTGKGLWDEFMYFKLDINQVVKYNITNEYVIGTCS